MASARVHAQKYLSDASLLLWFYDPSDYVLPVECSHRNVNTNLLHPFWHRFSFHDLPRADMDSSLANAIFGVQGCIQSVD